MKKLFLLTCVSALALATAVQAKNLGGGFSGAVTPASITTVSQIEEIANDSYVTMQGKIISKIGHEKYMFQDETGSIKIEIDDDDWNGVNVNPENTVQIEGEVDKSWTKPTKIEVDRVKLVK